MNIKAIGFDYGGVIGIHQNVMPDIAKILDMPIDQIRTTYFEHNHLANVDSLPYEQVWEIVLGKLNRSEKHSDVIELFRARANVEINQDVMKIIDGLRAQGLKIGVLSNNTKENGDKLREMGLDKHFDVFLISAEIGYQKPDREAFEILFKELDVKPEEAVYIDDSAQSLKLAEDIGYHPILFKSAEQLRVELDSLGLLSK